MSLWLKKQKNFLVFLGSPGVGKTYFCSALIPWIYGKINNFRYFTEREFLSKIRSNIDTIQGDYLQSVLALSDYELLIMDDIGSSGMNDWRREVVLDLIDLRYESEKPTVFTSNLDYKQIHEQLGARSHSRLFAKENLIIDMHGQPDKRQEEEKK